MRMHRGSSKGTGAGRPGPERLPLSASATVTVEVEIARGGGAPLRILSVRAGTTVKELVRSLGEAPEGSAVLVGGVSVPLDTPLDGPVRLTVVPTFSGG
jgi:sulfur carrier protein ThiS